MRKTQSHIMKRGNDEGVRPFFSSVSFKLVSMMSTAEVEIRYFWNDLITAATFKYAEPKSAQHQLLRDVVTDAVYNDLLDYVKENKYSPPQEKRSEEPERAHDTGVEKNAREQEESTNTISLLEYFEIDDDELFVSRPLDSLMTCTSEEFVADVYSDVILRLPFKIPESKKNIKNKAITYFVDMAESLFNSKTSLSETLCIALLLKSLPRNSRNRLHSLLKRFPKETQLRIKKEVFRRLQEHRSTCSDDKKESAFDAHSLWAELVNDAVSTADTALLLDTLTMLEDDILCLKKSSSFKPVVGAFLDCLEFCVNLNPDELTLLISAINRLMANVFDFDVLSVHDFPRIPDHDGTFSKRMSELYKAAEAKEPKSVDLCVLISQFNCVFCSDNMLTSSFLSHINVHYSHAKTDAHLSRYVTLLQSIPSKMLKSLSASHLNEIMTTLNGFIMPENGELDPLINEIDDPEGASALVEPVQRMATRLIQTMDVVNRVLQGVLNHGAVQAAPEVLDCFTDEIHSVMGHTRNAALIMQRMTRLLTEGSPETRTLMSLYNTLKKGVNIFLTTHSMWKNACPRMSFGEIRMLQIDTLLLLSVFGFSGNRQSFSTLQIFEYKSHESNDIKEIIVTMAEALYRTDVDFEGYLFPKFLILLERFKTYDFSSLEDILPHIVTATYDSTTPPTTNNEKRRFAHTSIFLSGWLNFFMEQMRKADPDTLPIIVRSFFKATILYKQTEIPPDMTYGLVEADKLYCPRVAALYMKIFGQDDPSAQYCERRLQQLYGDAFSNPLSADFNESLAWLQTQDPTAVEIGDIDILCSANLDMPIALDKAVCLFNIGLATAREKANEADVSREHVVKHISFGMRMFFIFSRHGNQLNLLPLSPEERQLIKAHFAFTARYLGDREPENIEVFRLLVAALDLASQLGAEPEELPNIEQVLAPFLDRNLALMPERISMNVFQLCRRLPANTRNDAGRRHIKFAVSGITEQIINFKRNINIEQSSVLFSHYMSHFSLGFMLCLADEPFRIAAFKQVWKIVMQSNNHELMSRCLSMTGDLCGIPEVVRELADHDDIPAILEKLDDIKKRQDDESNKLAQHPEYVTSRQLALEAESPADVIRTFKKGHPIVYRGQILGSNFPAYLVCISGFLRSLEFYLKNPTDDAEGDAAYLNTLYGQLPEFGDRFLKLINDYIDESFDFASIGFTLFTAASYTTLIQVLDRHLSLCSTIVTDEARLVLDRLTLLEQLRFKDIHHVLTEKLPHLDFYGSFISADPTREKGQRAADAHDALIAPLVEQHARYTLNDIDDSKLRGVLVRHYVRDLALSLQNEGAVLHDMDIEFLYTTVMPQFSEFATSQLCKYAHANTRFSIAQSLVKHAEGLSKHDYLDEIDRKKIRHIACFAQRMIVLKGIVTVGLDHQRYMLRIARIHFDMGDVDFMSTVLKSIPFSPDELRTEIHQLTDHILMHLPTDDASKRTIVKTLTLSIPNIDTLERVVNDFYVNGDAKRFYDGLTCLNTIWLNPVNRRHFIVNHLDQLQALIHMFIGKIAENMNSNFFQIRTETLVDTASGQVYHLSPELRATKGKVTISEEVLKCAVFILSTTINDITDKDTPYSLETNPDLVINGALKFAFDIINNVLTVCLPTFREITANELPSSNVLVTTIKAGGVVEHILTKYPPEDRLALDAYKQFINLMFLQFGDLLVTHLDRLLGRDLSHENVHVLLEHLIIGLSTFVGYSDRYPTDDFFETHRSAAETLLQTAVVKKGLLAHAH